MNERFQEQDREKSPPRTPASQQAAFAKERGCSLVYYCRIEGWYLASCGVARGRPSGALPPRDVSAPEYPACMACPLLEYAGLPWLARTCSHCLGWVALACPDLLWPVLTLGGFAAVVPAVACGRCPSNTCCLRILEQVFYFSFFFSIILFFYSFTFF